ncbi:MAG TPA: DUF4332 domain-containing protein [Parasegetibacter sp.]|jgi:predicted flap endonuclease-1-like 5' DNA nuclease
MPYNVEEIEGIGSAYAERLLKVGIKTTGDLLKQGLTKKGREMIAARTEIPESLVLTWVNHADLMRIKGVGGQFAELLQAAGVLSVRDFAKRKADDLHNRLMEVNSEFGLTGRVPSAESLQEMIQQAKLLDPVEIK